MVRFYHSSGGFMVLCVENVCVEPILISLNSILTEFVIMLVGTLDDTHSELGP